MPILNKHTFIALEKSRSAMCGSGDTSSASSRACQNLQAIGFVKHSCMMAIPTKSNKQYSSAGAVLMVMTMGL